MITIRSVCCIAATLALFGTEATSAPTPAVSVRVALVQMAAVDGDLSGNLAKMESYAAQAEAAGAKICVFPEWCELGTSGRALVQPIPGSTSAAIGSMAQRHALWVVAAIWEKVPSGVYDTLVIFDDRGELVHKQRKQFVGGKFDGGVAYNGTYQDVQLVPSPWGALGGIVCADTYIQSRQFFRDFKPALMFAVFHYPPADMACMNALASECGCPAVGANQVFPVGTGGGTGGHSIVVSETGATLWQAGNTGEVLKTWDLTLNPGNLPPSVDAGDVQTIRLPVNQVTLSGYATDDGFPGGTLTTTWSMLSGPGSVTFGNAGALSTTATFSASGVYVLRLSASDGALTRTDDVSVNVLPATGDLNLVGYWPFDGTAADQSGLGNNGSLVGTLGYSTDVAPTGGTNTRSLDVTFAKGSIQVPHNVSLNATNAVTMSLWIKPRTSFPGNVLNGGNSWAQFMRKGDTWGSANYLFGFGAYYPAYAEGVGCARTDYLDQAVLTPGVWYHVAAVLDSNKHQGKVYLNGTLDQTFLFGKLPTLTNSDPLRIGYSGVDGLIDDVRLYTRALSDAEIAALKPGAVVNQPPVVSAGPDVSVTLPAGVTLQGSYSDDGVATSAICSGTSWRKVSGPGDVHFGNRFALSTSATFSLPGTYVLELIGSDGAHRRCDTVRVSVNSSTIPPSIVSQPANTSVTAGQTATFSVAASGTAPLSYQWQKNNTDIPGAQSSSYTTPATTLGDNGATFRVVVSNSAGTAASNSAALTVSSVPLGSGTGLTGDYFDNMDFTALKLTRTDATVNFNWGLGSPDPSVGVDTFSVRWTGSVEAQYSQTYTFTTVSDDGVRLWVNGQLLVDNWTNHAATENSGSIVLAAGQKVPIRMEYYENGGYAVAKLLWSSASTPKQPVPMTQLYPVLRR